MCVCAVRARVASIPFATECLYTHVVRKDLCAHFFCASNACMQNVV